MRLTRFVGMCMAGAVLLMACEKENNYNDTIIAEPDNYPTEDAFGVRISRPTYVFPDSYTGEGKALVIGEEKDQFEIVII